MNPTKENTTFIANISTPQNDKTSLTMINLLPE